MPSFKQADKQKLLSTCQYKEKCWAVLVVAAVPLVLLNFTTKLKNAKQVAGVINILSLTFYGILEL